MVERLDPENYDVIIKFGGGLNTRSPEDEVKNREASDGQNFNLDARNSDLRQRPAFDLLGTAPNAASINGGGSYRTAAGTVIMFIQAGDTVYEWDGSSFQASPALDTVNSGAKLRGHWRSHGWDLDDKLLISDLALLEPIKEWDGTTWQDVSFLSNPSTAFPTDFTAKYINVADERVLYSNIAQITSGTPTEFEHMMVGSKRSDYATISVDDRPSSSLSEADPFFLLTPDLRAINGFAEAFSTRIISTNMGRLFELAGASAQDFAFNEFYPGSNASGEESLAYIGTDIIYGRQGRIESVRDTERFGDTEADDLTVDILDQVKTYTSWTTVYNSRLNRVYLFPSGGSEVWVFDTAMRGSDTSPWMKWVTQHALAFQPTFVMSMLDPLDGLEYVFMGDSSGNLYRLEGTGSSGDGGSENIQMIWKSRLFKLPLEAKAYDISGYIKYRKQEEQSVGLSLLFAGENVLDSDISVALPPATGGVYYNNDLYYNDDNYYGAVFRGRLVRQHVEWAGADSNEFQLEVSVEGTVTVEINEIGIRFRGSG